MKTELEPGEAILRETRANMRRKGEQAAGRLTLTDRRLIFEARGLNVHRETDVVARAAIDSVTRRWTKFFGFIPLAPNTLVVTLATGRELRFIVPQRDDWAEALAPSPLG